MAWQAQWWLCHEQDEGCGGGVFACEMSIQENAQQRDLEKEDFAFAVTNEIQGIKFDTKNNGLNSTELRCWRNCIAFEISSTILMKYHGTSDEISPDNFSWGEELPGGGRFFSGTIFSAICDG